MLQSESLTRKPKGRIKGLKAIKIDYRISIVIEVTARKIRQFSATTVRLTSISPESNGFDQPTIWNKSGNAHATLFSQEKWKNASESTPGPEAFDHTDPRRIAPRLNLGPSVKRHLDFRS